MIHCRERPNFHFIACVLSVLLGLFLAYANFSFYLSFFPNFLEAKKRKKTTTLESLPQSNSLSVYCTRSKTLCMLLTLNYLTITLLEKHQNQQKEFNPQTWRNTNLLWSSLFVCKHSVVLPLASQSC